MFCEQDSQAVPFSCKFNTNTNVKNSESYWSFGASLVTLSWNSSPIYKLSHKGPDYIYVPVVLMYNVPNAKVLIHVPTLCNCLCYSNIDGKIFCMYHIPMLKELSVYWILACTKKYQCSNWHLYIELYVQYIVV